MPAPTSAHRFFGLAACAALGLCAFAQPAGAQGQPRPAMAASAASAPSVQKRVDNSPLRFDPPAAGRRGPTRAEYEHCIEHPSLDGLYTDCSALLPDDLPGPKTAARAAKPR